MKVNKYYSKQSQIRHRMSYLLTIIISICYFLIAIELTLSMSIFSKQEVITQLRGSHYYENLYDEIIAETELALVLIGLPTRIAKETIDYETILIAASQQVENNITKGDFKLINQIPLQMLENGICSYLEDEHLQLTEDAQLGLEILISQLSQRYSLMFCPPIVNMWLEMKIDFADFMRVTLPISLILISAAIAFLFVIQRYKKKGLRYLALGIVSTSLITVTVSTAILLWKPFDQLSYSADYMKEFCNRIINNGITVWLIINIIGLLIATSLFTASKYKRHSLR